MEALIMRSWRRRLWAGVKGERVLEVGAGTGNNFPFYAKGSSMVAMDLSGKMLERVRRRREKEGVNADLVLMDAQSLAFRDGSFDCIVASFVFCTVPDPVRGLKEVARVLKPGGKAFFLEHMRSNSFIGRLMDLFNPLIVKFSGVNINRKTISNIEEAGMKVEWVEDLFFDIVRLIEARAVESPLSEGG